MFKRKVRDNVEKNRKNYLLKVMCKAMLLDKKEHRQINGCVNAPIEGMAKCQIFDGMGWCCPERKQYLNGDIEIQNE